ncbi:Transposable element P transposase, partial [Frankliniella fusca]
MFFKKGNISRSTLIFAKKRGLKSFLSEETDLGILVTLQSTLGLSAFLIHSCNYQYAMTARFNSDAIEQFFGQIRNALRQNPHPDPKVVAQMHRLLSVYSLVKSPKGSNVTGGDNVKHLLSCESQLLQSKKERKEEIDKLIDEVLTEGAVFEDMPFHSELDHSFSLSPEQCEENIISFLAGFTAFRQNKIVQNCEDCLLTMTKKLVLAFQKIKEIDNGYSYASPELRGLISSCERAIRESVAANDIGGDMFVNIIKYLCLAPEGHVGCLDHREEVTSRLIKYYLTMRMFFILDNENIFYKDKKDEAIKLTKRSKLVFWEGRLSPGAASDPLPLDPRLKEWGFTTVPSPSIRSVQRFAGPKKPPSTCENFKNLRIPLGTWPRGLGGERLGAVVGVRRGVDDLDF